MYRCSNTSAAGAKVLLGELAALQAHKDPRPCLLFT